MAFQASHRLHGITGSGLVGWLVRGQHTGRDELCHQHGGLKQHRPVVHPVLNTKHSVHICQYIGAELQPGLTHAVAATDTAVASFFVVLPRPLFA